MSVLGAEMSSDAIGGRILDSFFKSDSNLDRSVSASCDDESADEDKELIFGDLRPPAYEWWLFRNPQAWRTAKVSNSRNSLLILFVIVQGR
jgi:hypothetical protein